MQNNVLFVTTFSNKTDRPQTYSFKTERTTRSSCMVEVEQGFTKVRRHTARTDVVHFT